MLRVTYAYHGHHRGYIYDWAALSAELMKAGFVDVRRCDAGQSPDAEFKGLERRGAHRGRHRADRRGIDFSIR